MTRPGFGALSNAVAQTKAAIFRQQVDPTTLRSAEPAKGIPEVRAAVYQPAPPATSKAE